jgi:hypothetical protein
VRDAPAKLQRTSCGKLYPRPLTLASSAKLLKVAPKLYPRRTTASSSEALPRCSSEALPRCSSEALPRCSSEAFRGAQRSPSAVLQRSPSRCSSAKPFRGAPAKPFRGAPARSPSAVLQRSPSAVLQRSPSAVLQRTCSAKLTEKLHLLHGTLPREAAASLLLTSSGRLYRVPGRALATPRGLPPVRALLGPRARDLGSDVPAPQADRCERSGAGAGITGWRKGTRRAIRDRLKNAELSSSLERSGRRCGTRLAVWRPTRA